MCGEGDKAALRASRWMSAGLSAPTADPKRRGLPRKVKVIAATDGVSYSAATPRECLVMNSSSASASLMYLSAKYR